MAGGKKKMMPQNTAYQPSRNKFNLSHDLKMTMDMGYLYPCFYKYVYPGDSFNVRAASLARLMPQMTPVMHDVNLHMEFFAVPLRLLWEKSEDFFTGGEDGNDASVPPRLMDKTSIDNLQHWFSGGHRNSTGDDYPLLAFGPRAYNLIWNEWYRDQDLQEKLPVPKTSGNDDTVYSLQLRCWEKDPFTTLRPWAQKGNAPLVGLISGHAPVKGIGVYAGNTQSQPYNSVIGPTAQDDAPTGSYMTDVKGMISSSVQNVSSSNRPNIYADLDNVPSQITVQAMRLATQIQTWLERNAMYGSRYVEVILSNFGVRSDDARLQRPEFLGGGVAPVNFTEVLQTSSSDGTSPQANMAGHSFSAQMYPGFTKSFTEHMIIVGIVSMLPKTSYFQGYDRENTVAGRGTRYDWMFPSFAHLGMEPIFKDDLMANTAANKSIVLGYQPKYNEMRYPRSVINGVFRTTAKEWHLGRDLDPSVVIDEDFVSAQVSKRIFAITTTDHASILLQTHFNVEAIRMLPSVGTPGFMDHPIGFRR
jgi:hypothetical protein